MKPGKWPKDVKETLVKTAEGWLPPRMGRKYTDVVVSCLTGKFDEGGEGERVNWEDKAGYINNVVSSLEALQTSAKGQ